MHSILLKVVLLLILIVIMNACELFNKVVKPKLPPATMEGKNTFGCLINGKVFVNERTSFFGGNGTHAQLPEDNWLIIYAENENSGFTISLFDTTAIKAKSYTLINDTTFYAAYNTKIRGSSCLYNYKDLLSGRVTLTKLDMQRGIVSGAFEFVSYNPDCIDTVKITEGRFDIGEIIR